MLNDIKHKAIATTLDECKTWNVWPLTFTPSTINHNPTLANLLVVHDQVANKIYYSLDFGQNFTAMLHNFNVVNFYW